MERRPESRPRFAAAGGLELWAWLLFGAALYRSYVSISETLALSAPGLWYFFSSDTVQYGLLYRDLFEDGFHFTGWNISHAPEYLQMIVALLLRGVAGTLTAGHVFEAMTQPVLLALALRWTLCRLGAAQAILAPLAAAAVMCLVATNHGLDYIAFVWSNRHGYTAILSVLGLGLLIEARRGRPRIAAALALLVCVGVASDMLFLVWFVGPAIIAALTTASFSGAGRLRKAVLAIGAGVGLGLLIFWTMTPTATVAAKLGIAPDTAWGALGRISDMAFKTSPERTLSSLLTLAGGAVAAVFAVRAAESGERAAGVYAAALIVLAPLAVAATAAPFREAGYTRYLLAPQLLGLVVMMIALRAAIGPRGGPALTVALSVAILPGLRALPPSVPPATSFYPPLVECLDRVARKHRLEYGVADYWLAKYVTALSHSGLRVVSVKPGLDPFVDFTNIEWFLGGVGARRHDRPLYTFAIMGAGRPEDPGVSPIAVAALGEAPALENCQGYEVRVLPPGADERIRDQFRANPRIRRYYTSRGLPLP
jgi:hypothetical protein